MSKGKPSPGPWRVVLGVRPRELLVMSANGLLVADCGLPDEPETQANADLIAAALELLEALTQLANYFEVYTADTGRTFRGEEVWRLAHAAIAKSRAEVGQ